MNGMIGSSGTVSVPFTIVISSAIGLLLAPGVGARQCVNATIANVMR